MNKTKKILVTGGAGFIGSNLCDYLLKRGNEVICLDDFTSSSPKNIKELKKNSNFRFIKHDILKPLKISGPIDEIYHLACPASPVHYQKDSIRTLRINVLGSLNVLALARQKKAKILFTSTSEVYGDPLEHPQKESYRGHVNPIGPRACYDEGKRAAETLFFDYWRHYGINIKVVRIFNTYGPKMDPNDGRVVSNLILQALKDKPLTIYGNGRQTRSFQYIEDLINGLTKMMSSRNFIGPVNLGNPKEFTIKQLAELIKNLTNSKSKIIYKKLPIDDPRQRKPNISLAKRRLNWQPKIKLENGLKKTIRYFKSVKT